MKAGLAGHAPVVPPRIAPAPDRPDPALLDRLRHVPVVDVSDAVGRLYTMDAGIRPLYEPIARTVGVALTVKAYPGDNLAIHGALGMVRERDVLVIDWLGYAEGCGSGAQSLVRPADNGLAGVVVDGGWRDVEELRARSFPVFGRRETAFSPGKRQPGEINVPVCCGRVVVEAGDVVVGDSEGVAVIPRRHLADVVAAVAGDAGPDRPKPDPASAHRRHGELFEELGGLRG